MPALFYLSASFKRTHPEMRAAFLADFAGFFNFITRNDIHNRHPHLGTEGNTFLCEFKHCVKRPAGENVARDFIVFFGIRVIKRNRNDIYNRAYFRRGGLIVYQIGKAVCIYPKLNIGIKGF